MSVVSERPGDAQMERTPALGVDRGAQGWEGTENPHAMRPLPNTDGAADLPGP